MRRLLFLSLIVMLALVVVSCSPSSPKGTGTGNTNGAEKTGTEINIKAASFMPEGTFWHEDFKKFQELVTKKSNGEITIEFVGGPEVFPQPELAEAARMGMVDMVMTVPAFHANQVPEVLAVNYSNMTLEEMEKNGAIDWLNELHKEKLGVIFLPQPDWTSVLFFTTTPVKTIEDFKGLGIRGNPVYQPAIEALGASMVTVATTDIYSALERKIVDGTSATTVGFTDLGLSEVVKYKIEPSFYPSPNVWLANQQMWENLSDTHKGIIKDAIAESGKWFAELALQKEKDENRILGDAGVETVTIADADRYLKMMDDAAWKHMDKISKNGDKIRELFRK